MEDKQNELDAKLMDQQKDAEINRKKIIIKEWFDKHKNNIISEMNGANIYHSETGNITTFDFLNTWNEYEVLVNIKFDKIPDFSIDYVITIKFEDDNDINTNQNAMVSVKKHKLGEEKGTTLYIKGPLGIDREDFYQLNYISEYYDTIQKLDINEVFIKNTTRVKAPNSELNYFNVN